MTKKLYHLCLRRDHLQAKICKLVNDPITTRKAYSKRESKVYDLMHKIFEIQQKINVS
jgi:hypothetical protein